MSVKQMNKPLPPRVRTWAIHVAGDYMFDMPSGAGSLSGLDAVKMLDKGIDEHSDFDPDEIIDVLTEAARS